ncbi:MAG: hypothetical protein JXB88_11395 [Spirochaetales bacterium]|nr:hypothetical protein [Spirochaetales bacterium]
MDNKMKIYKEISYFTSRREFYEKAKKFGGNAKRISKTQLSNLLNLADTTFKVTDILNYIKNQAAKSKKNQNWNNNDFACKLIDLLYDNETGLICTYKKKIANNPEYKNELKEWNIQKIHLRLCRIFIRQMVVHYNYLKQPKRDNKNDNK